MCCYGAGATVPQGERLFVGLRFPSCPNSLPSRACGSLKVGGARQFQTRRHIVGMPISKHIFPLIALALFVASCSSLSGTARNEHSVVGLDQYFDRIPFYENEYKNPNFVRMNEFLRFGDDDFAGCDGKIDSIFDLYYAAIYDYSIGNYRAAKDCLLNNSREKFNAKSTLEERVADKVFAGLPFLEIYSIFEPQKILPVTEKIECSAPGTTDESTLPLIGVFVSGKCLRFAFDTGAPVSVVTQRMKIDSIPDRFRYDNFAFGKIDIESVSEYQLENVIVMFSNREQKITLNRMGINGVIGNNVIRTKVLRWDTKDKSYKLVEREDLQDAEKSELSYNGNHIYIGVIGPSNRKLPCLLDTASTFSSVSAEFAESLGIEPSVTEDVLSVGIYQAGKMVHTPRLEPFYLVVADLSIRITEAVRELPFGDGCVIGWRDLSPYDYEIDISEREFRWLM